MEVLKDDIVRQARYIPRAFILTFVLIFVFLFIKENSKLTIKNKLVEVFMDSKLMLFLLWLAFIMMSTIFSRWPKKPYGNALNGFGFWGITGWNKDSFENVVLFIPYTFLYICAFNPQKPLKSAIKLSLISTVTIELLQLIFWLGVFQFSDILHNLEGGMIGCGLWHLVKWIKSRRSVRTLWRWLRKIGQSKGEKL